MQTPRKSSRRSNYSIDEDEALVLAWQNVSLDPGRTNRAQRIGRECRSTSTLTSSILLIAQLDPSAIGGRVSRSAARGGRCDNPPRKIPYYRLTPIHFGH
jgi:hypothetical protein